PGPTAVISPCEGFSLALSGMMMPPLVFSSASIRLTTTRSCSGRNLILAIAVPLQARFSDLVCDRKWIGIRAYSTPRRGKSVRILSNRALGVLIVRPGIWLDADPVKQRGIK